MLPHKIKQTAPKEGKPNSKRHIDTTKSHGMIGYMPATGLTNPSLHLRTWLAFFPLASEGWFLFENEAHCDFHVCLGRAETENQSECRHNSENQSAPARTTSLGQCLVSMISEFPVSLSSRLCVARATLQGKRLEPWKRFCTSERFRSFVYET